MQDHKLIYRLHTGWNSKTIKIKKAGGQTNRNYIVASQGKKFFVRLPWEHSAINRAIEGENILRLSRNKKLKNILPRYYLYIVKKKNILDPKNKEVFNVPDGTMLVEYIEGKEFTPGLLFKKRSKEALVKMFHAFHASGLKLINSYDVFRNEIEKYRLAAEKLPVQNLLDANTIQKLKEIELVTKEKFSLSRHRISTHNDFLLQNFLLGKNGKMYLLDFEYAGLNQRGGFYYDFSFLFADSLFRKPAITRGMFEKLLRTADKIYKQKLNREQMYYGALAAMLVMVWWGLLRYFSVQTNKEKKYFKEYIQKRSKGLLDLYETLK